MRPDARTEAMTAEQAAWVREHVWPRALREMNDAYTPGFYQRCSCQDGICGACEQDRHDQCLTALRGRIRHDQHLTDGAGFVMARVHVIGAECGYLCPCTKCGADWAAVRRGQEPRGAIARERRWQHARAHDQTGHDALWRIDPTHPNGATGRRKLSRPTPGHRPTVLWNAPEAGTASQRLAHLRYRGACLGCRFEGPIRRIELIAAQDAHDHTHPGWRDQPVVEQPGSGRKWHTRVQEAYPDGWFASGGPVLTIRRGANQNAIARGAPGRQGYDLPGACPPGLSRLPRTTTPVSDDQPTLF